MSLHNTLGLALIVLMAFVSVLAHREEEAQTEFWRRMYLQADKESRVLNCEPLDGNHVICERSAHEKR